MKEMTKGLGRGDLSSACVRLFLQQTNNNNNNHGFAEDCETVLFSVLVALPRSRAEKKPGVGWMGLEFFYDLYILSG